LMAPPGNDGYDGIANSECNSDPAEATMASSASVGSLQAESGQCASLPNLSKKERPCKGRRARYRRLVQVVASRIEADPAIFDMDDMELNLPELVKKNPWLKQKFMRRMENLKQSLAEQQQPMYVTATVEVQDGLSKAFAAHPTSDERQPNGFFEPMNVFVGKGNCQEKHLVMETDKVGAQLRILHGEGYDTPATMVMIPRIEDIGLPMKILSGRLTITNPSA